MYNLRVFSGLREFKSPSPHHIISFGGFCFRVCPMAGKDEPASASLGVPPIKIHFCVCWGKIGGFNWGWPPKRAYVRPLPSLDQEQQFGSVSVSVVPPIFWVWEERPEGRNDAVTGLRAGRLSYRRRWRGATRT